METRPRGTVRFSRGWVLSSQGLRQTGLFRGQAGGGKGFWEEIYVAGKHKKGLMRDAGGR